MLNLRVLEKSEGMFDDPDNHDGDFNRLNVDNTEWVENDDIGSLLPPHICWARRIVIYSMDAGVGWWWPD